MYTILNQFPCDLGGRPANNVPNFILHGVSTGEELPPLHNLDKVLPSVDMRFMPTDVNSTCNQFCLLLGAVFVWHQSVNYSPRCDTRYQNTNWPLMLAIMCE